MRCVRIGGPALAFVLLVPSLVGAQDEPFVSLVADDLPLPTVLQQITDDAGLTLVYDPDAVAERTVSIRLGEVLASSALKLVCQAADCRVILEAGRWVVEPMPAEGSVEAAGEMMQRGDYEEAARVLDQRLAANPDDVPTLFAMVELRCATDQFPEALPLVARLRELGLEDRQQLAAIDVLDGRAKVGRREFTSASDSFAAALEKDPDCLEAYIERAKLCERQGKYEQAAADWRAYLERDATSPTAQAIRLGCVVVEDKLVREDGNSPTWSPDGQTIAYVARRGTSRRYEVRAMDAETGADRLLFAGDGSYKWCLDWSPDGRTIAWEARGRTADGERVITIEILDLEAGEAQAIERPYRLNYPRWHPDGLEILCYTLDMPHLLETVPFGLDGPRLQFEPLLGATYAYADWSPDGRHIISSWNRLVGENYSLYLVDTEDPLATHRRLMEHDGSTRIRVAYSPDGRLIAYLRSFEQYIYMLYVMAADGSGEETRLTSVRERNDGILGFGWAPDSRRIAYGTWDSKLHILRLGGLIPNDEAGEADSLG